MQVPQMKDWGIKAIENVPKLLQYRNGIVRAKKFGFRPYEEMSPPDTKVYWLITTGNDGSYIADNFVARHELPKFEEWPYTYATIG